jgi:hypothetical protein
VKGVDLYEGGIGDIRPQLSMFDTREEGTSLSACVREGIEESKFFGVLLRVSVRFPNRLRFATWAAQGRFIARRDDRKNVRDHRQKCDHYVQEQLGLSDRRVKWSSVTDLKVWHVGVIE